MLNATHQIRTLRTVIDELCEKVGEGYLKHVHAYCSWQKVDGEDPDEKMMRSLEEIIGISENGKKVFREEMLIRISTYERRGKKFGWNTHQRLREAVQKVVSNILTDEVARISVREQLISMTEGALTNLKNGDLEMASAAFEDIRRIMDAEA